MSPGADRCAREDVLRLTTQQTTTRTITRTTNTPTDISTANSVLADRPKNPVPGFTVVVLPDDVPVDSLIVVCSTVVGGAPVDAVVTGDPGDPDDPVDPGNTAVDSVVVVTGTSVDVPMTTGGTNTTAADTILDTSLILPML